MASPTRTLATTTTIFCRRSVSSYQPCWHHRHFQGSARCMVNPLSNLSHFSAAKEAQFLSKEKRIPREEFHPYLQLIRSSEVDPFAPVPGASPSVIAALERAKSGQADTDSALRLAVSNLIDQLKASNREKEEILRALVVVQERYRKEERNALLMLFSSFGLLAFILVKTRALDDLVDHVRGAGDEWNAFNWDWLENSSSHLPKLRPGYMTLSEPQTRDAKSVVISVPESSTGSRSEEFSQPVHTFLPAHSQSEPRGLFSRLFWASSGSR